VRDRAAKAQIQAYQAAVEAATINLNFTRIVSPIDGIAGIAQAQVGDLVKYYERSSHDCSTSTPSETTSQSANRNISDFAKQFFGFRPEQWKLAAHPGRRDAYPHQG